MPPHPRGQHVRRQNRTTGIGKPAHEIFGKGKTVPPHHIRAVIHAQEHDAHTHAMHGRGKPLRGRRFFKVRPHSFGLAFHPGKKAFLRNKAGNRIRAHSLGASQILKDQPGNGGQNLQQGAYLTGANTMQHDHAQKLLFPDQGQEQLAFTRQQLRLIRSLISGKIQGMPAEGKKGCQLPAQQSFHFHKVFTGQLAQVPLTGVVTALPGSVPGRHIPRVFQPPGPFGVRRAARRSSPPGGGFRHTGRYALSGRRFHAVRRIARILLRSGTGGRLAVRPGFFARCMLCHVLCILFGLKILFHP
ncbi:hypothetical protein CNY67_03810 [Desulfovibrio sp. G11]|nr:hypothetical protein CNY67_03810 [Desulfovibrio sp. G11]